MTDPVGGDRVGDFEIIRELERSESGVAYEAKDSVLGRNVTLWLLSTDSKPDAAAELDHPNIGVIYQIGDMPDGHRFVAMARYEGETLQDRLSRGPIDRSERTDIARQAAAALSAAHSAGVVHGNINASNIFLTRQGQVKLLNFGTASRASSSADDVEALEKLLPETRTLSRPRNTTVALAIAAVLLIIAVIGARRASNGAASRILPELAVLQVGGDSSNVENVQLASALQDEIAARLVALKRVKLVHVAPDSAGHFPSRANLELLRLAIQQNEGDAAVSISLTDSRSGHELWSDRRSFSPGQLRELGRDIVIEVLESIGQPATDEEKRMIGATFPSSAEAYEEFLAGNTQLARRSPPSIEAALHHYRRASVLDSTFAAAFARQAYGYAVLVDWGWKPSKDLPADMLNEGTILSDRAIRLDSTSADAWLARAYILRFRDPRKFAGAIQAFEHAIALDPYNAEAFHQYGQALMALGRYTEAYAAYRRSLDLEPGRATELGPMAALDERQGRLREGIALLDSAVAAAPQVGYVRAMRSMFRSQAGKLREAQDDATDALALDSSYRMPGLAALARALWLSGERKRALNVVAEAERSLSNPSAPDPTEAFWLAMAEVATQRPEKAVELLRNARPRGAWLWFYFGASDLDEFRKRPDVSALMADMDPRRQ